MIHWELCKKFRFDHTNKWYVHNPASFLENNTHKLLWNFDIQTDHLISARRPDRIKINKKKKKKNKQNYGLCNRIKLKESEKKDKYLDLARELKKLWNIQVSYINRGRCFWYSHQRIIKGTRELGNKRSNGDHPNYYIIKNGQNTEQSQDDLRRLEETRCHSNSSERPSAKTDAKNSQGVNNNDNNNIITNINNYLI